MSENEMGYRGSKSDLISRFVKEQRVDGSYFSVSIFEKLRCTLMDCESNYPFSNPSKLIIIPTYTVQGQMPFLYRSFYPYSFLCPNSSKAPHKKKLFLNFKKPSASKFISQIYSPLSPKDNIIVPSHTKLEPGFVTGITDAEGCFGLYIYTNTASKI